VLLPELKTAAAAMNISITPADLDAIFGNSKSSARELRHSLVHHLGPSNIKNVQKHCAAHIKTMTKFLGCIEEFHAYQRRTF
jgi:hypothetical protein